MSAKANIFSRIRTFSTYLLSNCTYAGITAVNLHTQIYVYIYIYIYIIRKVESSLTNFDFSIPMNVFAVFWIYQKQST